jgi:FHA domain
MNDSPASLSDKALACLIFESKTTLRTLDISTDEVFARVRRFSRLYGSLPDKPDCAALLYQDPRTSAVSYHVIGARILIGRLAKSEQHPTGCDLAPADEQLSKRHFEIVRAGDFFVLRDLGSSNGTYVNHDSAKISETVLKAGDIILAGRSLFVFTGS